MAETEKITFEEFEKRWSQLERIKEIRKKLPITDVNDFIIGVNSAIAEKQEELMDLIPEVIKNI